MATPITDLIRKSQKIMVAGHLTPDFDDYACVLFVYNTIKKNFPDKIVKAVLDTKEPFSNLAYLASFQEITYSPIYEEATSFNPDLFFFVDGNFLDRFSPRTEELRALVAQKNSVMLDHHKVAEQNFSFFLNEQRVSCVEVVHDQLIKREGLIPFEGWEMMYLTGVVGDSYRFYYESEGYRETFQTISDILDKGFTLREVSDRLFGYSRSDVLILSKFTANIHYEQRYAYTYLTMDDYKNELKGTLSIHEYKKARRYFIDEVLNKLYEYNLCFTLAPDETVGDGKTYAGSFRSKLQTVDTTVLASELGGGGHVSGSGFTVIANSLVDAISIVKNVIDKNWDKAQLK